MAAVEQAKRRRKLLFICLKTFVLARLAAVRTAWLGGLRAGSSGQGRHVQAETLGCHVQITCRVDVQEDAAHEIWARIGGGRLPTLWGAG
jgi:hypothetical protein